MNPSTKYQLYHHSLQCQLLIIILDSYPSSRGQSGQLSDRMEQRKRRKTKDAKLLIVGRQDRSTSSHRKTSFPFLRFDLFDQLWICLVWWSSAVTCHRTTFSGLSLSSTQTSCVPTTVVIITTECFLLNFQWTILFHYGLWITNKLPS